VIAQALNLTRHANALRDFRRAEFGTGPEAPTDGHVNAVNQLMAKLRVSLLASARKLHTLAAAAVQDASPARLQSLVVHKHRSHERVRQIEKIWDYYLELFGQRQSRHGMWLLGCDRIALDCYQLLTPASAKPSQSPHLRRFLSCGPGFGPATYPRFVKLSALGKQMNPFPLVQLPYHRLVNPWTLGAVLHEVAHNLQNDLGLARAVPRAIARRLLSAGFSKAVAGVWTKWNRETFADLSGLLLGGPGVVASLMDVVGRAPEVVFGFSAAGVHPTPYLRVLLSVELLRRMNFPAEAERYRRAWLTVFPNPRAGNIPGELLRTAPRAIELVVDSLCYQPFAELGGKKLSEVFRFAQKEQRMVEETAGRLARGDDPGIRTGTFSHWGCALRAR
jgi:plasmid stabilization system protein ParE